MPGIIPPWLNKVNFIVNYFWEGCEAPFKLFVDFAGPPAGQAVALLIDLSMDDIVKGFFRPAGLRSHRHGRKGARGRRKIPDLPDPNDEIAKRLPFQKEISGRRFGTPTRYLFEVSDVADRVAFNLAIVDVVTDTVYEALLGIVSVGADHCWWMRRGRSHGEWDMNIQGADYWRGFGCGAPVYEKGVDMNYAAFTPGPGGRFLATVDASFYQGGPTESTHKIALRNENTGVWLDESDEITLEPGQSGSLALSANIDGGTTVGCWIHKTGNQLWTREVTADCVQFSR